MNQNYNRRLPNFIIIGSPKCGTTSLSKILNRHPNVVMSKPKEPRFFSHDQFFSKGLIWYTSLFTPNTKSHLFGEASTSYSTYNRNEISAHRIHRVIPDVKLIYCVRHPIKRLESIWTELSLSTDPSRKSFSDGVVTNDFNRDIFQNPGYIYTSCYFSMTEPYRKLFNKHQLYIQYLEDRILNPSKEILRIFNFLDLPPFDVSIDINEKDKNSALNRRIPNLFGRYFIKFDKTSRIRSKIPALFKKPFVNVLTTKYKRRPAWQSDTYSYVCDLLQPDISSFLSQYEKSTDYWNF